MSPGDVPRSGQTRTDSRLVTGSWADLIKRNEIVSSQVVQPRTRHRIGEGLARRRRGLDLTVQAQTNGIGFRREPHLSEYVTAGEFALIRVFVNHQVARELGMAKPWQFFPPGKISDPGEFVDVAHSIGVDDLRFQNGRLAHWIGREHPPGLPEPK